MNSPAASEASHASELVSAPEKVGTLSAKWAVGRASLAAILLVCGALALVPAYLWFPLLRPAEELMVPTPPPEIALAREAALSRCRLLNSLMIISLFTATAGGGLAFIAARARSGQTGIAGRGVAGAAAAVGLAALGVIAGHAIMDYLKVDPTVTMYRTMGAQGVLMALLGTGLGLAMGLGVRVKGSVAAFAGKGAIAGLLATILYLLLTGIVLADSQSDYLIPGGVLAGGKDLPILITWLAAPIICLTILLPMAYRDLKTSDTTEATAAGSSPAVD